MEPLYTGNAVVNQEVHLHEVKMLTKSERNFYSSVTAFMIGRKSLKALNQLKDCCKEYAKTFFKTSKKAIQLKLIMALTKAFSKRETQTRNNEECVQHPSHQETSN